MFRARTETAKLTPTEAGTLAEHGSGPGLSSRHGFGRSATKALRALDRPSRGLQTLALRNDLTTFLESL